MWAVVLRKLIPALLTLSLLVVGLAAPAEAKPRVVRGGFTATATPFPNPWWSVPGMNNGCASGVEGQHKVSRPFTAPFAGWFHVTLFYEGDWDLHLADKDGYVVAESWDNDPGFYPAPRPHAIDYFLADSQEVAIVACNWAGAPEAEVRYVLRAARAWPEPPTGEITHEEVGRYDGAAVATTENMAFCAGDTQGCPIFAVWGKDRSASIRVEDASVSSVAFRVNQFHKRTRIHGKNHCGSTKAPILIHPRADMLKVFILLGPCEGQSTAYIPTTGTIHLEFKG
jgi:hypothetical protein